MSLAALSRCNSFPIPPNQSQGPFRTAAVLYRRGGGKVAALFSTYVIAQDVQAFSYMRNAVGEKAPPSGADFIDTETMLERLPISRRTLMNWREQGKIPFINLGGRRVLFHWPAVEQALLRNQRQARE